MSTRPTTIVWPGMPGRAMHARAAAPGPGETAPVPMDRAEPLSGGLLLVECSRSRRASLQRGLTGRGFQVTGAAGIAGAESALAEATFALCRDQPAPARRRRARLRPALRERCRAMRIVVVTDADSFASVIRRWAPGPTTTSRSRSGEDELVDALLDRAPVLPPVPETPLGLSRTCWEHVMRIYEQCDRNVTHTAQRLGHAPALAPAPARQAGAAAAGRAVTRGACRLRPRSP